MRESATRSVRHPLNVDYPPIPLPPDTHDYAIVGTLRKVLRTDARSTSAVWSGFPSPYSLSG